MVKIQIRLARCSRHSWMMLHLLLALCPLVVLGDSSFRNGFAPQPPPPPQHPSPLPPQGSEATTNNDAIQVLETEVWDGENWIGPQSISRWTTMDGRSCVSPAEIEAPANGEFEGDWKIVLGDDRDDYGWKYVYYYMSTERPTRQRIWLRSVQFSSKASGSSGGSKLGQRKPCLQRRSARLMRFPSLATLSKSPTIQALRTLPARTQHLPIMLQSALQIMKDDWNFKGYGFSFYKSFLFKKSFGFAFRLPITTNWDLWDRHPEWPNLSMSVAFFYPFTAVVIVGGSVNVEWVRWCVVQACIILRHVIALVLLNLARGLVLAGSAFAFPVTGQLYQLPNSNTLLPTLDSTFRQRPTFSTTLQERVGVSFSWRVSSKRGYEFRRTVWHLFLPTLLSLLQHVDRIQQSCQKVLKKKLQSHNISATTKYLAGFVPVSRRRRKPKRSSQSPQQQKQSFSESQHTATAAKVTTMSLMDYARNTKWAEFWLQRKTGSLGVSTGYPIPDKPHFSCSAVLSLSGFYFRPDTIGGGGTSSSTTIGSADAESIGSSIYDGNKEDSPVSTSMTASAVRKKTSSSSALTAEQEEENATKISDTSREHVKMSSASKTATA